jgi:hypothetical protein
MIRIEIKTLLVAAAFIDGASPLQRLFAIPKAISVSYPNRRLPQAVCEELAEFEAARVSLAERHNGVRPNAAVPTYAFHDEKDAAMFEREYLELCAQQVELPGEPYSIADLSGGSLLETDYSALAPFLLKSEQEERKIIAP